MEDTLQTWGRPQSSSSRSGDMSGLLFVGGLPLHACDQNLTRYFRRFGPLDSAEVQRRSSGRSKGYAFLKMKNPADTLKVLYCNKAHMVLGKRISVELAEKPSWSFLNQNKGSKYVVELSGIPAYFTKQSLIKCFGDMAPICDVWDVERMHDRRLRCLASINEEADYFWLLGQKHVRVMENIWIQVAAPSRDGSKENLETSKEPASQRSQNTQNGFESTYKRTEIGDSFSQSQLTTGHSGLLPSGIGIVGGHQPPQDHMFSVQTLSEEIPISLIKIRPGLSIQTGTGVHCFAQDANYRFVVGLRKPHLMHPRMR